MKRYPGLCLERADNRRISTSGDDMFCLPGVTSYPSDTLTDLPLLLFVCPKKSSSKADNVLSARSFYDKSAQMAVVDYTNRQLVDRMTVCTLFRLCFEVRERGWISNTVEVNDQYYYADGGFLTLICVCYDESRHRHAIPLSTGAWPTRGKTKNEQFTGLVLMIKFAYFSVGYAGWLEGRYSAVSVLSSRQARELSCACH